MALGYLGIDPSPEQQHTLRTQLLVDNNGTVAYGDFVQAARDLFRLQLDESASEPTASTLTSTTSPPETALSTQVVAPGAAGAADLDRTTRERNEALKELKKVKDQLAKSEKSRKTLSEELQKVRQ
ncbi:syntaxin-binding protein 4-like, partial [Amblyraja radiata]|uniref:syntaxin-binding protein 4-like n=1 Tax=Amblyraja radiata TaxID=386614 RepID=UPI001403A663